MTLALLLASAEKLERRLLFGVQHSVQTPLVYVSTVMASEFGKVQCVRSGLAGPVAALVGTVSGAQLGLDEPVYLS